MIKAYTLIVGDILLSIRYMSGRQKRSPSVAKNRFGAFMLCSCSCMVMRTHYHGGRDIYDTLHTSVSDCK